MHRYFIFMFFALVFLGCSAQRSCPDHYQRGAYLQQGPLPQMSDEEMMRKMKTAATPKEEHANLQPLVGEWRAESKWWKEPGANPDVASGTAANRWILGNRFLEQEYHGKFFNQPFEGRGVMGYDNVAHTYVANWIDSMGTGIMSGEGSFDAGKRSLEMTSKYSCPVTEGPRVTRSVTRIIDDNRHVFEMYDRGPDGKEFKAMEITYVRAK